MTSPCSATSGCQGGRTPDPEVGHPEATTERRVSECVTRGDTPAFAQTRPTSDGPAPRVVLVRWFLGDAASVRAFGGRGAPARSRPGVTPVPCLQEPSTRFSWSRAASSTPPHPAERVSSRVPASLMEKLNPRNGEEPAEVTGQEGQLSPWHWPAAGCPACRVGVATWGMAEMPLWCAAWSPAPSGRRRCSGDTWLLGTPGSVGLGAGRSWGAVPGALFLPPVSLLCLPRKPLPRAVAAPGPPVCQAQAIWVTPDLLRGSQAAGRGRGSETQGSPEAPGPVPAAVLADRIGAGSRSARTPTGDRASQLSAVPAVPGCEAGSGRAQSRVQSPGAWAQVHVSLAV